MRHQINVADGRKCWARARERNRIKARFNIRDRVLGGSDDDDQPEHSSTSVNKLLDKAEVLLLKQLITYIKSGDRSKFSLTHLDRNFHLISCHVPASILLDDDEILLEHSLQLCIAWFGFEYADSMRKYMTSLKSFNLMEYAVWMGKYSIVGGLLMAGANPCLRGTHSSNNMETSSSNRKWEIQMGDKILKMFFNCFPLRLATYIVKRVVDMRVQAFEMEHTLMNQDGCQVCGETLSVNNRLSFKGCGHSFCEKCLWQDLCENLANRGDHIDVVLCPKCGADASGAEQTTSQSSTELSFESWSQLTPKERRAMSMNRFYNLPPDTETLKFRSKTKRKKKQSELDHLAPSWTKAVTPSLGSTQAVRRDKFFFFVERNSVHFVRGTIHAGIDIDLTNEYGHTALYIASMNGSHELVRLLLESGADCTITANDSSTAFEIAVALKHKCVVDVFRSRCFSETSLSEAAVDLFPQEDSPQHVQSTILIAKTLDHPGAGSFYIDKALSNQQLEWLLALHKRLPVDLHQKEKAGLCSQRAYYCDSRRLVCDALEDCINISCASLDTVRVLNYMRFLHYSTEGAVLNPHVDLYRVDPESGVRSTHTFILYMTDCSKGGETALLQDVAGEGRTNILSSVSPVRGRLLLFPHACPHEGKEVRCVPKILLRGEAILLE